MAGPPSEPDGASPTLPGGYEGGHPARNVFNLLGRAHAMSVLFYLVKSERERWRFNELEEALGASPNTLSKRLDELEEAGFLERISYDEIPPRVEYEATRKARELDPVLKELRAWADEHGLETGLKTPAE
ncbi:winged helix-turn-helix transcriptional regulator [Salinirussus salinus]|jgi:DNA-binding HxlR family transcriptional regulator|uniref:winged helix-turn-helix transcriptional regulator n=1 Tax=Salinirussus salinus TaxID=1198300 RepID=UPI0013569609|nr:helix-turn-helix domain-containing protein [Salinirussus salinus]